MTDPSAINRDHPDTAFMEAAIALTYDKRLAHLQRVLDLLKTPAPLELQQKPLPEPLVVPDFVDVRGDNGYGISPLWITISDAEDRDESTIKAVQQAIKGQSKQRTLPMKSDVSKREGKKETTTQGSQASSGTDKPPSKKRGQALPELEETPGLLETVLAQSNSVKTS
jgi:hypothetical protein